MADEGKRLATIDRNPTEQLQISVKTFKDKQYLDLRIFYTTDEGASWLPTKKGVTVAPDSLEILKNAVDEAINELCAKESV